MNFTRRALLSGAAGLAAVHGYAKEPQLRLRAADIQSYEYPTVQALLHMDRTLRASTQGRLSIQVFAAGQLGQEEDTIEQTRIGAVHLTRVNVAALVSLAPLCNLFCAPNLLRSDEQLSRVLDSAVMDEVRAQIEALDLVALVFYETGARSIYNKVRPLTTPAHMRGLRMRTQRGPIMEQTMAALGAVPVALSYSQLLPALQADLVDGAENNWPSYVTTDQHRAAPYLTLTEHARIPEVVLVSKHVLDGLSGRDRDLLREAALASRTFHRLRFAEWTQISREQARAEGVQVISKFDREAFGRLWAPIRDSALRDDDLDRLALRVRDLE